MEVIIIGNCVYEEYTQLKKYRYDELGKYT